MGATATVEEMRSVRSLISEYERLNRTAREAAARGEELERQLSALRQRRDRVKQRASWGEEGKFAALDAQITDLEGAIVDAKAEFDGFRTAQAELVAEAKALLESQFKDWAALERRKRAAASKALEEIRQILLPAASAIREAEEKGRQLETLKGFIMCKGAGLGLQRPGCEDANGIRKLLDRLRQSAGLSDPSPEEAGAGAAIAQIAASLGI